MARLHKKKKPRHQMSAQERLKDEIIDIVTTTVLQMFSLALFATAIASTFFDWFGNSESGFSIWNVNFESNKDFFILVISSLAIVACMYVVYLALADIATKAANIIVSFILMIIAMVNLGLGTWMILDWNAENVDVKVGAYVFIIVNAAIVYINSAVLLINRKDLEEVASETVEELEKVV